MSPAFWLLTWRTYGSWLPGVSRGFVSNVRGADGSGERHNVPGTECERDQPGLERYARTLLKGEPILLTADQAALAAEDFRASAAFRNWLLPALAVMANHVHLVVSAPEDVSTDRLLQVFKSYASRKLNQSCRRPAGGTWWAVSGSRRRLPTEQAVDSAIEYVKNQEYPLVIRTTDSEPGTIVPG